MKMPQGLKNRNLIFSEIKCLWYQVKTFITKIYTVNYNTWYTVCIFIETKTDIYDIWNIPDGFSYVAKNRKIFKHKSGGIVVVYKKSY